MPIFISPVSDQCALTVPFLMLADLFDVIPLDECEIMFNLVEDRVSIMKSVSSGFVWANL